MFEILFKNPLHLHHSLKLEDKDLLLEEFTRDMNFQETHPFTPKAKFSKELSTPYDRYFH